MDKRALLFRIGGLGDLLVALPAISVLRRSLPGFLLTLVGRPEYTALLKRAGVVDETRSFEDARVAALFATADGGGLAPEWARGYALAFGWLNRRGQWPGDSWWIRRGFERVMFASHESSGEAAVSRLFFDRTRRFFGREEIPEAAFDECAQLPLDDGLRTEALGHFSLARLGPGERRLVVHPGSGGRRKCWPLENFLEVVRWAGSRGIGGVVVTGEAEADWEPALAAAALPEGWTWTARPPLAALAGLLAESTHYLGNDSGPTHLAAACGASVLALFAEGAGAAWRPFGRSRVLSAPAVDEIRVEVVLAELGDFPAALGNPKTGLCR